MSGQLVGGLIARRAGAAHVLNEHTPLRPDGELLPPRIHQRLLTRLVAPRVDRVIAVTGAQLPPLARLGYRPERMEVIANGVFGSGGDGGPAPDSEAFTVLVPRGSSPRSGWAPSYGRWPRRGGPSRASAASWPATGPNGRRSNAWPRAAAWSCSACAGTCPP